MTIMADLIRRECACGTIWYQLMTEPPAKECNECFKTRRLNIMTTTQVRDDLDQTAPEEAAEPVATSEETNGHTEKPKRKYVRKASAAPETNGHEPEKLSYIDTVKARANGIIEEVSREIEEREIKVAALKDEILELLSVKASLTGTVEVPASNRPALSAIRAQAKVNVAPRKETAKKPGRRPRRSVEDVAGVCERIVKHLKANGASKTEELRAALKIEKPEWLTIAKHLKEDKRVKTTGEKRATTWTAK